MSDMVIVRKEGLYCVPGQFYIDPWWPVDRAVITHAHGDHARRGHKHYLASSQSVGILKSRLGQDIHIDAAGRALLRMLTTGLTDEAAARRMGMSLRTYRRRVAELMRLLEAESRFQAGVRAGELGLAG